MNGYICSKEDYEDVIIFFERVKSFISRCYYNLKNGIRNLWKWLPIVWCDRPWDYIFILKTLRFKLDETQKCLDGSFVGSEEEVKKIRSLIEAIDRIIEDDYVVEEYKVMDEKYGKLEMIFNDDNTITTTRTNLKEEDKEQERKETLALAELEADRRQKDINYVFDIMKNNIQRWWV